MSQKKQSNKDKSLEFRIWGAMKEKRSADTLLTLLLTLLSPVLRTRVSALRYSLETIQNPKFRYKRGRLRTFLHELMTSKDRRS